MDRERKLRLEGTLAADERAKSKDDAAFQRRCTGSLNECPFSFHADGGPLINVDPNEPYTFTVDAQAADISLAFIDVGLAKNAGCSALLAQTAPFEAGEKP